MADRLLTIGEVAEITRTPLETLRYWRSRGEGPHGFKLGRRVVYSEAALNQWIAEKMNAQRSA